MLTTKFTAFALLTTNPGDATVRSVALPQRFNICVETLNVLTRVSVIRALCLCFEKFYYHFNAVNVSTAVISV